jgi:hypothetical protein
MLRDEVQVMENHHQKQTRNCAHCGQLFIVNPRVGRRHRYCSRKECDRVSRAIARSKWLRKNGGRAYFNKTVSLTRVRAWRQKNPRYWRKRSKGQNASKSKFIVSKKLTAILRYVALQDTIDTNLALKIGIISHLTGSALQDTIAKEIRRLMLRGHAILRGKLPDL